MPSPSSCARCSRPLVAESASGLCPTCLSAGDTSRPPPDAFSPLANPAALATATFLPDIAGSTVTREPSEAEIAGNGVTASLATPVAAPEPAMPPAPVGYELVRKLGHGGMGDVYLARDVPADRLVAVKFLRAAHNPVAVERFLTEVRALARVTHPGIVRVLAHDFFRSVPFFAMPYVPGGTLAQRVSGSTPLESREAASLIAAAARAVHSAHEAGVVHRDIKPSNILLDESGSPLVSDFGLAKRTDEDGGLTTGSGPLGTLSYMPPEQTRRGDVDRRADVYGLGATLYHLLTGRPPFSGPEPELLAQIVSSAPRRPRAIRPEIPLGLEAVVVKCLEKDPAARYPSAAAMAADLERFLAGGDPDAPPMTRWRRARLWARQNRSRLAAGVAVAAIAVALVAAGKWLAPTQGPGIVAALPPPPEHDQLAVMQLALADGQKITPIARTGLPRWHNWRVPGTGPIQSPKYDNACYIAAVGYGLLDVMAGVGRKGYRVTLELKQHDASEPAGEKGKPAPAATAFVGMYLADTRLTEGDITLQPLLTLTYNDLPKVGDPKDKTVFLRLQVMKEQGDKTEMPKEPVAQLQFKPAPGIPGEWRVLRLEVTPDEIRAFWGNADGTFTRIPQLKQGVTPADWRERLQGRIAGAAPNTKLAAPDWNPARLSVGLICHRSAAVVRNLTVEPLD